MNGLIRKIMTIIPVMMVVFGCVVSSSACTAVYVGADASTDGTAIIARSNDNQAVWANYLDIVERVENEPGRTMAVGNGDKVLAPLPDTTYRYTATPLIDAAAEDGGIARDGAVCSNEYGVSMTMSVSAFTNETAQKADPLVESGINEFTANELVICQSRTAREAVQVLLSLIDEYGSSENNIAMISDQKEVWYVEMYTGHQYAAVKLPSDCVSVFGNEFCLEYLSDYEESITSRELKSLAKKKGFAKYGRDGEMNIRETYSMPFFQYSHMRTWMGHKLLAASKYGDYEENRSYPLVFHADEKVSVNEVFGIMKNRFEGTKYCPDDTGRKDMRVIGTDTALSVHIVQTYPKLPSEMSVVTWVSSGPAAYGVFVPFANCSTEVAPSYGEMQPAEEYGQFDTDTYAFYVFKGLNSICVTDADAYGRPVQKYWKAAEKKMTSGMDKVLKTASENRDEKGTAAEYVTSYCVAMQDAAFADGQKLLNDATWMMSNNSNTMKKGRNPETQEILDEDVPLEAMKAEGSSDAYGVIPEFKESVNMNKVSYILFIAVLLALAAVLFVRKKKK